MALTEPALPPSLRRRRRAIVLVHGAWVGEWSWTPVIPLLTRSRRAVHAVSLTGHGARRHQGGSHVTLADHVADVAGVIETFDLTDVTMVGHSYGGRVITAAYPSLRDRVARLVYLDAHAPVADDPGQSPERVAEAASKGGMLDFPDEYQPDLSEFGDAAAVAWFLERVTQQSFATFNVPLGPPLPDALPKTYVAATRFSKTRFSRYAAAARAHPAWDYHELPGSHWLMFSHPRQVADIILA